MKKKISRNIYLAQSPLQLINCAEAAFLNKGCHNILILRMSSREENDRQLKAIVNDFGWDEILITESSHAANKLDQLKAELVFFGTLLIRYRDIEALYIGDFRSRWMLDVRALLAPQRTVLVDDGDVTLNIQKSYLKILNGDCPRQFRLSNSGRSSKVYRLYNVIKTFLLVSLSFKRLNNKKIDLFTGFKLNALPGQIIDENKFRYLNDSVKAKENLVDSIYYFGSKYSEAGVLSLCDEIDFLRKVSLYLSAFDVDVYYIPHRDDSAYKTSVIELDTSFKLLKVGKPAEILFIKDGLRPTLVAAAYSSVINNVHGIISRERLLSFKLPLAKVNGRYLEEISYSYDNFVEQGIRVVDFYSNDSF